MLYNIWHTNMVAKHRFIISPNDAYQIKYGKHSARDIIWLKYFRVLRITFLAIFFLLMASIIIKVDLRVF